MNQKIIGFILEVMKVEIEQNGFEVELESSVDLVVMNIENEHGEISQDQELTSNFAGIIVEEIEQWISDTKNNS